MKNFVPSHYQPSLNEENFILEKEKMKKQEGLAVPQDSKSSFEETNKDPIEEIQLDVLFVGAGPAGLAGALHLAQLVKNSPSHEEVEIGVLEKASSLGGHSLSGAIIQPRSLKELFPGLSLKEFPFRGGKLKKEALYFLTKSKAHCLPRPPNLKNKETYIASLSELVRWMGQKAEALGVNLFTSCSAEYLIMDKSQVLGIRTSSSGLDRMKKPLSNYNPPLDIKAKVTVLAEGSRGLLTQAYLKKQKISSLSPQIFSLGVKELWRVPKSFNKVLHTLNWPLPSLCFGGGFMYPMGENRISLGLLVGLDAPYQNLDTHLLLQKFKSHPFIRSHLKGGEVEEWGAKTIPEGGFYSVPEKLYGHGLMIVGDSAGLVNVPSLKGIHYAIQSGIYAAQSLFQALKEKDFSENSLKTYDQTLRNSYVMKDLEKVRNVRAAFKRGLLKGMLKSYFMILTKGRFPRGKNEKNLLKDAQELRFLYLNQKKNKETNLSSSEQKEFKSSKDSFFLESSKAVYLSKNKTRDDIPSHLKLSQKPLPKPVEDFYIHLCPAGVYERNEKNEFVVNAPNCIDCKATDVLGPRWTPREGGSGPNYRLM